MSDDEYASPTTSHALTRSGGHAAAGTSTSHRKGPRFSWTPAYEATFFRSLCDSVQLGLKDNHSFKQEAWERAAQALQERHGAYPNKGHLINKSDNARKKFRLWRGLREDPEFLYNPTTKVVTASEDAWRAHIEREPLSRSLRGRPFEHEEYMEILFPDVIGSGGAPKRVTKSRRRGPDVLPGSGADDIDTPGTAVLDLLAADGVYQPTTIQQPQAKHVTTTATVPPNGPAIVPSSSSVSQRPTSTTIPSRTSVASATSALTPPDEEVPQTRKRFLPPSTAAGGAGQASAGNGPPEKRRRTAANNNSNNNYIDLTHPAQLANQTNGPATAGAGVLSRQHQAQLLAGQPPQHQQDSIQLLAEALRQGVLGGQGGSGGRMSMLPTKWVEQAMEIFFRDFADEDYDLQIKIAEKALADSSKAMMFVLMPEVLRRHWVKRLREVHARSNVGEARIG